MRRALRILFLTSIWVLLWGTITVANVAGGVVVASMLLVLYPTGETADTPVGRPRPIAFSRLIGYIFGQLVLSNAFIAREILTRGSNIRTGIVACRLRTDSEPIITFLANVLSLTPGTIPVHVQVDPPVIYVHVLHLDHPDTVRTQVERLEDLTVRAFGSHEAIASLSMAPAPPAPATDAEISTPPVDESGPG
ncbi:MAG: Na+/H+ antiporter subunit E [Ilumatobacteraceae bacterium]